MHGDDSFGITFAPFSLSCLSSSRSSLSSVRGKLSVVQIQYPLSARHIVFSLTDNRDAGKGCKSQCRLRQPSPGRPSTQPPPGRPPRGPLPGPTPCVHDEAAPATKGEFRLRKTQAEARPLSVLRVRPCVRLAWVGAGRVAAARLVLSASASPRAVGPCRGAVADRGVEVGAAVPGPAPRPSPPLGVSSRRPHGGPASCRPGLAAPAATRPLSARVVLGRLRCEAPIRAPPGSALRMARARVGGAAPTLCS